MAAMVGFVLRIVRGGGCPGSVKSRYVAAMLPLVLTLACDAGHSGSGRAPPTGDSAEGDLPDSAPLAEVDVLVVGSGAGGLGAAWAAREAGATVLVIERDALAGGASNNAGNYWAAGTPAQEAAGIIDSPEAALAEWASFTEGDAADPSVIDFVNGSAGVIAWLESLGISFHLGDSIPADTGTVPRVLMLEPGVSPAPLQVASLMTDVIQLETTATGLVLQGARVAGVWVTDKDGAEAWIHAGATVLATGGFARNDAMVVTALPELAAEPVWYEAFPGMDGNGITLAATAGATTQNMDHLGLYSHAIADARLGQPEVMVVAGLETSLIVDAEGRRVADERLFGSVSMGRRFLTEGPFYAVFDDDLWASTRIQGRGYNYTDAPDELELLGPEYAALVGVAEGIDGAALGEALGISGSGLTESLARYNDDAAAGTDTQFGKPEPWFAPLADAPFHALPLVLGRAKSFGGVATDATGAVTDSAGERIPGLYAAGEVCGFLGTPAIGYGLNGSITSAWWAGLRAGKAAAAN